MSSDESPNGSAQSERRDAVREKAQQVHARQTRGRAIRRVTIASVLVALVAVGAIVVTWAVSSAASKPVLSPANVIDDGFAVTGVTGMMTETDGETEEGEATPDPAASPSDQPAVDIRVYVDYLSSGSHDFQVANGSQLAEWVSEDAATLSYYPVAMLTAKSNGTKYSLRAASAAACMGTHSPDTFFAYTNALLAQQPDIESDGLSDSDLADLAIASGAKAPKTVRSCIENRSFETWAKDATDRALKGLPGTDDVALTGTPMILVNGTPYVGALDDPKEFAQFVLTIASDAYYDESPTATPTPTP
jgi:hypothetical protein